jgi:hypothetical protein
MANRAGAREIPPFVSRSLQLVDVSLRSKNLSFLGDPFPVSSTVPVVAFTVVIVFNPKRRACSLPRLYVIRHVVPSSQTNVSSQSLGHVEKQRESDAFGACHDESLSFSPVRVSHCHDGDVPSNPPKATHDEEDHMGFVVTPPLPSRAGVATTIKTTNSDSVATICCGPWC